jgi:death-on-curing protein
MIHYLRLEEVLLMHREIINESGGSQGIRDISGLQSALTLPQMSMFGEDLYPGEVEKAAILGYAIITDHPFIDGNKRIGHAVMESFLIFNGLQI